MSSNLKTFTDEEAGATAGELAFGAVAAVLAAVMVFFGVRFSSARPGL